MVCNITPELSFKLEEDSELSIDQKDLMAALFKVFCTASTGPRPITSGSIPDIAGSRMMRDLLNRQGHHIGRRHTRTLMKKMGIQALYCKPNLSQANQAHRKYPYLLNGLVLWL